MIMRGMVSEHLRPIPTTPRRNDLPGFAGPDSVCFRGYLLLQQSSRMRCYNQPIYLGILELWPPRVAEYVAYSAGVTTPHNTVRGDLWAHLQEQRGATHEIRIDSFGTQLGYTHGGGGGVTHGNACHSHWLFTSYPYNAGTQRDDGLSPAQAAFHSEGRGYTRVVPDR